MTMKTADDEMQEAREARKHVEQYLDFADREFGHLTGRDRTTAEASTRDGLKTRSVLAYWAIRKAWDQAEYAARDLGINGSKTYELYFATRRVNALAHIDTDIAGREIRGY